MESKGMKARHPRAQGLRKHGVGVVEKGTSWGKRLTLVGHRGAALGDHSGQRKEVAKGTASEPCIPGRLYQRCLNLLWSPRRRRKCEEDRAE